MRWLANPNLVLIVCSWKSRALVVITEGYSLRRRRERHVGFNFFDLLARRKTLLVVFVQTLLPK